MRRLFIWLVRKLLSLRYRIKVKEKGITYGKGILFIPNHPAEIDPIIMMVHLWNRFKIRPLVVDHFFHLLGASFFMKLCNALPIPNFETSTNQWKRKQAERTYKRIKQGLAQGENFLIYPSGHLKREAHELIGGSIIHDLLQTCPDAKVVMIRTTGLWGSSFSRAITGKLPDFWKVLARSAKVILKNGIFFVPKRDVSVEMCIAPEDFPRQGTRLELNQYLDRWFNRYIDEKGEVTNQEPLIQVSYSRFRHEVSEITFDQAKKEKEDAPVDPKIEQEVIDYLSKAMECDREKMTVDTDLVRDLGMDSLDVGNACAFLDERYHIATLAPGEMKTVRDLCLSAQKDVEMSSLRMPDYQPKACWPEEDRLDLRLPKASTLLEAFLHTAERMGSHSACADGMVGILSYKQVTRAALVLARKIRKMPGDYVGLILPSSAIVNTVLLATWLAGKTPVMINWTSGVRTMDFAKELLGLESVITSRRFLDRLDVFDPGELNDALVLLEDLKQDISLIDKIKGLLLSFKSPCMLIDTLGIRGQNGEDTAVVLFTSGTESYPKAVPLTHRNILSDQRASLSCMDFHSGDIMYSVLPPFHSFGFSITGTLPLLIGMRVFYAPDPTDGAAMARDIAFWKTTITVSAPSFYKNLFRVAHPQQLTSVRMFVTGAEKAPDELFKLVKDLGTDKKVVEGYGITECAPVVTICRSKHHHGVGPAIPGVEMVAIDPETDAVLPQGETGEICIRGDNVFNGYLGDSPDPFIEIDGQRYYRSGDIGHLDKDDCLILEGRLKRFVKIGGEMISLGAIEKAMIDHFHEKLPDPEAPAFAIGIREGEPPKLVLVSVIPLTKEEVNQTLRDKGFGRIVKVQDVHQVETIPVTGTGKVHYRVINELVC